MVWQPHGAPRHGVQGLRRGTPMTAIGLSLGTASDSVELQVHRREPVHAFRGIVPHDRVAGDDEMRFSPGFKAAEGSD